MASENINRKIAVIFATDVVGYSTSMEANEVQTLKNLKACKKILDDLFLQHGGHVFNTAGDSDNTVTPSSTLDDFKEYEFTANDLDEFIAFSIKIRMQGTNSSEPPRLKDLRAIALAT